MRLVLLAFCAATLAIAVAGTPDFSGTWKMDPTRSESAHQDVPIGSVELVIRQTTETFSLQTKRREGKSSATSKELLTFGLDGREQTDNSSGIAVTVKAHWDGSRLVAETSREINGATVTTRQVFQLGSRGKELTVEKTLTVQHGYQGVASQSATGTGRDVFVKVH